ncbi:DDE-type integrase/transposase/recombinase [Paraburkholderia youngii]|uniref:DDE-type integrase/transposase/recombinase n=1 Tax=Paraburkholderia youngii TaxID=2782701 RepID=UPI003D1F770F
MSDVWSNDISDIALAARQKEDAAEHQSWLDTLKTKGWTQGLPSNASDSDKTAYEIGTARESAYQTRAYEGSLTKSGSGLLTLSGNNTYRGLLYLLWRAVDQHGAELDVLLQKRRDKAAAKRFFKRLLAACPEVPRKIVTDQLRSYPAAKAEIPELANVKHVFVKASARLNNRAENSHQPTRERERRMRGFRNPGRTQVFLSNFGPIRQHFALKRHLLRASLYRKQLSERFAAWHRFTEVTQNPSAF